jgi:hypothetical protein
MTAIVISHLPPLPNGTGSGAPKGTDLTIATDTTDTSESSSGTTKKYTRAAEFKYYMTAQGYSVLDAVLGASNNSLSASYDNGVSGVGATLTNTGTQAAFTVDGVTFAVGNRVLIKNQSSTLQNGIYVVTVLGTASTNWVLTRSTDYDEAAEVIEDQVVLVNLGTVNAGKCYQQTATAPVVIGTTPLIFVLFSPVVSATGFQWIEVTDDLKYITPNNGYIANNAASTAILVLPAVSAVGAQIKVVGKGAGGWALGQLAGQSIQVGNQSSATGVIGLVASTDRYDALELVCTTANTIWTAQSAPMSSGLLIV